MVCLQDYLQNLTFQRTVDTEGFNIRQRVPVVHYLLTLHHTGREETDGSLALSSPLAIKYSPRHFSIANSRVFCSECNKGAYKRIGKKSRTEIPFDGTKFKGLEKAKKTSQTVVARAMGVSQSTIWRWKKKKCIRKHTNAIKPLLNDKNKLDRTQQTYYLTPREVEPHRGIQSKRYVPKIMFMCAVATPIFSNEGELIFDGKIGIFPFAQEVPAKRS
ncbi:uncharacterized protein LOC130805710 [Amaranthus tricolor]|uniref:uncharacterized protein LOC130805710 n=1 Tax=Amaranthus tricolor TaxID=29722 RepID=UPI00258572A0|nr:uncharacterized protein LOC130805710 [Amaranthus tricolor]